MDESAAAAPTPARSIGERLRAGRERAGLSIAAAAEKLHLDNKVIEALEADRFAELGASVYVRGHLRRVLHQPADRFDAVDVGARVERASDGDSVGPEDGGKDHINVHRIQLEGLDRKLGTASRLKTDYDFFALLHRAGRRAARRFLDQHFEDVGRRSTLDLVKETAA